MDFINRNSIFLAPAQPPNPYQEPMFQTRDASNTYSPPKQVFIKNLGTDKKEPIKGVRKAMVKTMTQANMIPHFSYCDEYNMDKLVELRNYLKQIGKERGLKLSYLPILIKV